MRIVLRYFFTSLFTLLSTSFASAQGIRPVRDTVGYCWNPSKMNLFVRSLATSKKTADSTAGFVAAIAPHDDYLYAGRVYYPLFKNIHAKEVVIFGVTHRTVRSEIGDPQGILLLDSYDAWNGCGRTMNISPLREFIKEKLNPSDFRVDNRAHRLEHSIEAMIPWLQYFDPDVRITPIMVTAMPFERMEDVSERLAGIMTAYIDEHHLRPGRDIFFLCSCDANHYGKDFDNIPFGEDSVAHATGVKQDRTIADATLAGNVGSKKIKELTDDMKNVVWCGRYSVPFGLLTAEKTVEKAFGRKLAGTILRCSDSYTESFDSLQQPGLGVTAPVSLKHWVSYVSVGYELR